MNFKILFRSILIMTFQDFVEFRDMKYSIFRLICHLIETFITAIVPEPERYLRTGIGMQINDIIRQMICNILLSNPDKSASNAFLPEISADINAGNLNNRMIRGITG